MHDVSMHNVALLAKGNVSSDGRGMRSIGINVQSVRGLDSIAEHRRTHLVI